jgi:hypothetical protein
VKTTLDQMRSAKRKPMILWTCDVPGWAYHNRIETMRRVMPQYDHRILYFGTRMPAPLRFELLSQADVIVCQGVKAMRVVSERPYPVGITDPAEIAEHLFRGVVVRIDSMRVDINGQYVDIFAKNKSALAR